MDAGSIAAIVIGTVVGVWLFGCCFTMCCVKMEKSGNLGDGLNPIFKLAMGVCWPFFLLSAILGALGTLIDTLFCHLGKKCNDRKNDEMNQTV